MPNPPPLETVISELIFRLRLNTEERMPETGEFDDIRVAAPALFRDGSNPGHLELTAMHMTQKIDPQYANLRFVVIRVRTGGGGAASSTCLHGTRAELLQNLAQKDTVHELILQRVMELAAGLPQQSDPDKWK